MPRKVFIVDVSKLVSPSHSVPARHRQEIIGPDSLGRFRDAVRRAFNETMQDGISRSVYLGRRLKGGAVIDKRLYRVQREGKKGGYRAFAFFSEPEGVELAKKARIPDSFQTAEKNYTSDPSVTKIANVRVTKEKRLPITKPLRLPR